MRWRRKASCCCCVPDAVCTNSAVRSGLMCLSVPSDPAWGGQNPSIANNEQYGRNHSVNLTIVLFIQAISKCNKSSVVLFSRHPLRRLITANSISTRDTKGCNILVNDYPIIFYYLENINEEKSRKLKIKIKNNITLLFHYNLVKNR